MERVFLPGKMAEGTKESMLMIRNKAKENSIGQMEDFMTVNGSMVNSMELVFIFQPTKKKNSENGKMVKELSGLRRVKQKIGLLMNHEEDDAQIVYHNAFFKYLLHFQGKHFPY